MLIEIFCWFIVLSAILIFSYIVVGVFIIGWIIVLVVLCNIFLLECGFFFLCLFFVSKMSIVVFLFMIWFHVFRFIDFFILGLLVLFYVFGDSFILLFD